MRTIVKDTDINSFEDSGAYTLCSDLVLDREGIPRKEEGSNCYHDGTGLKAKQLWARAGGLHVHGQPGLE